MVQVNPMQRAEKLSQMVVLEELVQWQMVVLAVEAVLIATEVAAEVDTPVVTGLLQVEVRVESLRTQVAIKLALPVRVLVMV